MPCESVSKVSLSHSLVMITVMITYDRVEGSTDYGEEDGWKKSSQTRRPDQDQHTIDSQECNYDDDDVTYTVSHVKVIGNLAGIEDEAEQEGKDDE